MNKVYEGFKEKTDKKTINKNNQKKIFQALEINSIDKEGNKNQKTEINKTNIQTDPPFIKMYCEYIIKLNDLPKSSIILLLELAKRIQYDGTISITGTKVEIIRKLAGLGTKNSYYRAIKQLIKKEIMIKLGSGEYILDPHLFGKGPWENVTQHRNAYIELKTVIKNEGIKTEAVLIKNENKKEE